jgi:hypothetical protein
MPRNPHIDRFNHAGFHPGVAATLHLELRADPEMMAAAKTEFARLADADRTRIFELNRSPLWQ